MDKPGRREPADGIYAFTGVPTIVFLTVNTHRRHRWLANTVARDILHEVWQDHTTWMVGDFVVMPDHLHCFCSPIDDSVSIEDWIKFWKSSFRKLHDNGEWKFQSKGWHHRLRQEEKWTYMMENPVRAGLITKAEDWPYRGRVHELRW